MSVFSAVSVLERDPDLAEDLRPEEFVLARQPAVARLHNPKAPGRFAQASSTAGARSVC